MLEAYALGAVAPEEGAHIEEHLGECLACWDHLSESQRAAALLALAVPLEEPREDLRRRIIAQAQRRPSPSPSPRQPVEAGACPASWPLGRRPWPSRPSALCPGRWSKLATCAATTTILQEQAALTRSEQVQPHARQLAGIRGERRDGRRREEPSEPPPTTCGPATGNRAPSSATISACARGQGLSALDHLWPGSHERRHLHRLAGPMPAHRVPEVHLCPFRRERQRRAGRGKRQPLQRDRAHRQLHPLGRPPGPLGP